MPGSHLVEEMPVPSAPVPGQTDLVANEGDVFLYNTALWHSAGLNTSPHPRYAILVGWCRPWLWRGFAKARPPPHGDVLERAGEDGAAIFGLTQMESSGQFDTAMQSPLEVSLSLDQSLRTAG